MYAVSDACDYMYICHITPPLSKLTNHPKKRNAGPAVRQAGRQAGRRPTLRDCGVTQSKRSSWCAPSSSRRSQRPPRMGG
eukprot:COSAG05_NODE_379_length_10567_cov_18.553687_23_plen_80_part_00